MKCKVCGGTAVISLKAYNNALCANDFISFLENRVLKTIQKYRLIDVDDRPLIAVSGGKDSLSLWHILDRLGYATDGIYIDLSIKEYSQMSLEKVKSMADRLKRKIYIFHLEEVFGKDIESISRIIRRPPCSACGMLKRYVMNKVSLDMGYNMIITGHNLDDEASALLGNLLYWKDEYLWKKGLELKETEGHLSKKIKPLFLCSEREMAAYAILNNIDYIHEECPFSLDAKSLVYKDILNRLEESSPGTKLQFLKGYLKVSRIMNIQRKQAMSYCKICGYLSSGDICSFCRLMERLGVKNDIKFHEYKPKKISS